MSYFIDVIIPVPLKRLYTYRVSQAEYDFLKSGMRVMLPFGKSKTYTALVYHKHQTPPQAYEAKSIIQILDSKPVVQQEQLKFWTWISDYYLSPLGNVFLVGLPNLYRLESTQYLSWKGEEDFDPSVLSDDAFLVYEALQTASSLELGALMKILNRQKIFGVIQELAEQNLVGVDEKVYEKYKDKLVPYIKLSDRFKNEEIFELISRSEKQRKLMMTFFAEKGRSGQDKIKLSELLELSGVSRAVLKGVIDKGILHREDIKEDRVIFTQDLSPLGSLSAIQTQAYQELGQQFQNFSTVLLQGATGSGKTHVYTQLIQDQLDLGKQVLLMLPEIGLTTQIISRLENYFGNYLLVFHSKYNQQERMEVYQKLIDFPDKPKVVVGARSTVLLPLKNLGLIIVDEEHEPSYKQQDPAPRFNARDAAVVLGHQMKVKVLLGSATPSLETKYNATQNKYGFVILKDRHKGIHPPEINLVDLQDRYRKKKMKGHFSEDLISAISDVLKENRQVILFQNRRGFAPLISCKNCGHSPHCPNCDVSLTFHKGAYELRCHYCYYKSTVPKKCSSCGSHELDTKGFGTEQIAKEAKELFPDIGVGRMDMDTTRRKNAFKEILHEFESGRTKILVGTQMLSKGLDFDGVGLVGVMQADAMLNFPDFRAHERAFQLLTQVAGRSGRSVKGRVLIQTFNPYHQILQQVSQYNYQGMYKEQLEERYQFHYPPFYKLIKFTFKHKNELQVAQGADWFAQSLSNSFGNQVLGPTIPSISRVRNQYIRHLMLKIPPGQSLNSTKAHVQRILNQFDSVAAFRSIRFTLDIDPV
ncbi:MAG: replication restart helicase PriA [Flavobacteriaceae bacterium]